MPTFHAKTGLDRAFEITLLYKGIDGLLETISGIAFLFIKPEFVVRLAHGIVGYHPHNFIGKHILESAQHFGKGAAIFAALYLLSHGVVKVVLVAAIWREKLWAYLGLIIVTAAFTLYQLYDIIFRKPTFSFIALTLFDFLVIYLTAKEYTKQKDRFAKRGKVAAETE